MSYSVKAFYRATGKFHAYIEANKRHEWKCLRTTRKHAKEFGERFPEFVCVVVDGETDECLSKVTGVSCCPNVGLRIYTHGGSVLVPPCLVAAFLQRCGFDAFGSVGEVLGMNFAAVLAVLADPGLGKVQPLPMGQNYANQWVPLGGLVIMSDNGFGDLMAADELAACVYKHSEGVACY